MTLAHQLARETGSPRAEAIARQLDKERDSAVCKPLWDELLAIKYPLPEGDSGRIDPRRALRVLR